MKDEQFESLEHELRRLHPAALPNPLAAILRNEPDEENLTFSDRVLATFSACGALAACVIVALTVWQLSQAEPSHISPADVAARQQLLSGYQELLAAR